MLLAQLLSASVAPTGREEIRIKQLLKCPRAHLRPINSAKVVASALNFTQAVFKRVDSRLIFITSSLRVSMQEAFDIVSFPADRIPPATFIISINRVRGIRQLQQMLDNHLQARFVRIPVTTCQVLDLLNQFVQIKFAKTLLS